MLATPMWLAALMLARLTLGGEGTYTFTERDLPPPLGFGGIHKFYISDFSASKGQDVVVHLKDVRLSAKAGHEENPALAEATAEIALIPYSYLAELVNSTHFCDFATWDAKKPTLMLKNHTGQAESLTITVKGTGSITTKKTLKGSGVYLLLTSNCGNATGVDLQGTVMVRTPHGFLDGLDFWKTQLYLCLVLSYGALLVANLAMLALRSDFFSLGPSNELRSGVVLITLLGLVEVGTYYSYLLSFNTKGEGGNMNEISETFGIMKAFHTILVWMYLADGEHLRLKDSTEDNKGYRSQKALMFAAMLLGMTLPKSCVFAHRHHFRVTDQFVNASALLLALALVILLGSLSYLMRRTAARLEEDADQTDEVRRTYKAYTALVLLAFVVGIAAVLGELFLDVPDDQPATWKTHVFWSDGLVQCGFVVGLAITTLLVKPGEMENKGYLTVENSGAPPAVVVGHAGENGNGDAHLFADDVEACDSGEEHAAIMKEKEETPNEEETASILQNAE